MPDAAPDSCPVLTPAIGAALPTDAEDKARVDALMARATAGLQARPLRRPIPAGTRGWAAAWEPAPDPTGCRGLEE